MNRILVVNVNWMGDVIFSSPVFKALKEAYPQAHISCLAVPRVKEILECISYVDEIIEYDEQGRHRMPWSKLSLIWQLRKKSFDGAFLLHRSLTRALLVYLAQIPVRVGYDTKKRGKFLTHKVKPLDSPVHRSDHYLNVIESFGITVNDRQCQLTVAQKASDDINVMLKARNIHDNDYLVVMNPGGNWDLKRWPPVQFSHLLRGFKSAGGLKILIAGAKKDIVLAASICDDANNGVVNCAGQTSLIELMALMKRANLVITADSGPLHLASSVGTDVIGLFGPTRPEVTGPRGSGRIKILQHDVGCNRQPCYHLKCQDNVCMQSITVNDVLKSIEQIRYS